MNGGEKKMFYGWWIVVASSIIIFIGTGIAFYSFSVFMKPLESEFGWSRSKISLGVALWALVFGFSGPFFGVFFQKYGAKKVITVYALIAGICYVILGVLSNIIMFYIIMVFVGFSAVGITLIPNQTLISNWFEKYRGRAMGFMMAGIGFGGLTMPPLANYIITEFGWRTSFVFLGLLILFVIIPITLLIVRTKPSDMGLEPDGITREEKAAAMATSEASAGSGGAGLSVKGAVGTISFWAIFIGFALLVFGESGLTVHIVALIDDAGVSSQRAAFFWGLAAGISCVGRLGFGALADRWNPRNLITLTHGMHAVAMIILLVFFLDMGIHSSSSLLPFSIVYGLSLGGSAVLLPVLVGRCFGILNFSKLLGLLMSGFAIGVLAGPLVGGRIYDATGNYRMAVIVYAVGFGLAALAISFSRPGKYDDGFEQPQEAVETEA